jgi:hypothetical protein
MKKFNLSIDTMADIEPSNKCAGSREELELYNIKIENLKKMNNTKRNDCINVCNQSIYKSGQNANICNYDSTNLMKLSSMVKPALLAENMAEDCSRKIKMIDDIFNEENNIEKFSELKYVFPLHILSLKHIEKCNYIDSKDNNKYFTNIFKLEKINGITLTEFIRNHYDEKTFYFIIIQLFYVMLYANINGYYHNDLNIDNIMIYYNNINHLSYDQLKNYKITISDINLPIIKLIDYSSSTYNKINTTNCILDLIYILYQIEKYFPDKSIITEIIECLNLNNKNIKLKSSYGFDTEIYRLLLNESIYEKTYHYSEIEINNIFLFLQTKISRYNKNINIEIINTNTNKENNFTNVNKENTNIYTNPFFQKYLKYKEKYLKLKLNQ